ncbi:lysostaphin resistance A-like protein [Roseivirga sp. BDSF3-8]|uniref:CPBP family intramembrane glutamic endopeptidase n=1 Tax=Roseivirga sp. BDSF3-8 TaxID=3241598 RepID=UPI0035320D4D
MMKERSLKSIAIPVIAVILCVVLYLSGYFQIIFAALIVLLASWIEYGRGAFKSLGFQRSNLKAIRLLVVAPLVAGMMFTLYWFVLIPVVTHLTGQPMDFSFFESYKGDLRGVLSLFPLIWISAAFGEEIVFRGYLMRQFIKFFGSSKASIVLNILLFGVLFGWIHMYQGLSGQIVTGIIGVLFATIFYVRKYDLWFNIAVHGFVDTIALVLVYFS